LRYHGHMKLNLFIEADANISLFCEGFASDRKAMTEKEPLNVKLGNAVIANLITGAMACQVEFPGKKMLKGRIRRSDRNDSFLIETV
jgi:hypothetical protein